MKPVWLLLISLLLSAPCLAQTHEILRPTAESDLTSQSIGCSATDHQASTAMPNAWDAAGLSTSSDLNVFAVGGINPTSRYRVRQFTNWGTTLNTYTALTVNVNSADVVDINGNGEGSMAYSTDSGTTWHIISTATGWTQATFPTTLSASQNLSTLRVAVCVDASGEIGGPGGSSDITVWDIWTDGTFTAATPTPTPALNPVKPAVPSPVVVSRLWSLGLLAILVPVYLRRRHQ